MEQQTRQNQLDRRIKLTKSGVYDKTKEILKSNEQHDNLVRIKNEVSFYGEILVSHIGVGQVFGDVDVVLGRDNQFSLVAEQVGSVAYLMDYDEFHRYFMKTADEAKTMTMKMQEKGDDLLMKLAVRLYAKWYQLHKQPDVRELTD